jgi:hypothetical protein
MGELSNIYSYLPVLFRFGQLPSTDFSSELLDLLQRVDLRESWSLLGFFVFRHLRKVLSQLELNQ